VLSLELLSLRRVLCHIDVQFHGTYFVVAHFHVLILEALVGAAFAFIYFAAARWFPNSLNNFLASTHFVLTTVAFVLIGLATNAFGGLALRLGVLSFLIACVAFVTNVGWTAIKLWRLNRHA
jgi:hypothetical protein